MTGAEQQRCRYATDPIGRPDCQLTAVVRYGPVPLCADCDQRRSTLGKGQPARQPPTSPPVDPLHWIATAYDDLRAASDVLHAAVLRARQHGHPSWAAIASTLGAADRPPSSASATRNPPIGGGRRYPDRTGPG
jgi:hypothetical protein